MTENEAIKILEEHTQYFIPANDADALYTVLDIIQRYREIGTVEECREAVEKQKSKSPTLEGDGYDEDGEMIYDTWICPSCGEDYEVDYDDYDFCPNCGQRILH